MAAVRTEHNGGKGSTGKSAYWGKRVDAKRESNKRRRRNDKESTNGKDA